MAKLTKEQKRDKAFEKIHKIFNEAWGKIEEIAQNELGFDDDYERHDYMEEMVSITFKEEL
jgi:hypothetical protein